jgi:hypothetical protein
MVGRGCGMWATLRETRENRPEKIVAEPLIHLSFNRLIGEQKTADKNARYIMSGRGAYQALFGQLNPTRSAL